VELDRLIGETTAIAMCRSPRPESVSEAMDVLYEIQDGLMFNEDEED